MTLLKMNGRGQIEAADQLEDGVVIANDLDLTADELEILDAPCLVLIFPVFRDGRAFTQAQALRRSGYKGDLRATGGLFLDQLHYAIRCGFTSFDLEADISADAANVALARYSKAYQRAGHTPVIWEARS